MSPGTMVLRPHARIVLRSCFEEMNAVHANSATLGPSHPAVKSQQSFLMESHAARVKTA